MARSRWKRFGIGSSDAVPFLLLVSLLAPSAVFAISPVECGTTSNTYAVLPEPAVCLRRDGIASDPGTVKQKVARLFGNAEGHIGRGRFDAAEQSLDCAEAVLAGMDDSILSYELIRRRGLMEYHRERMPQALLRFECALTLSRAREDGPAMARDLRNVGSTLRRLGDFRGALSTLSSSLDMQRTSGKVDGAVLTNIADVYRDLGEFEEAMAYYQEAHKAFEAQNDDVHVAHVLESMSVLSLDHGDAKQAGEWLEQALATYRARDNRAFQLRTYGGLVRTALASGDVAQARRWTASGLAIASEYGLPVPAPVQLQFARAEHLSGRPGAATARIRGALVALADGAVERGPLLVELASIQEATGGLADALSTLRHAYAEERTVDRARHDRQLTWLRTRFETAERDRTIAALETENRLRRVELRQRTLLFWLTLAIGAVMVMVLWLLLQRRRQRERLQEAARRVRQEEELARYRREADGLVEDLNLLQTLLDSRDDAVCLLDAEGQVLAANRAACRLLDATERPPHTQSIMEFLEPEDHSTLIAALERMEDSATQTVVCSRRDGTQRLRATLSQWEHGDGLIVLELAGPRAEPIMAAAPTTAHYDQVTTEVSPVMEETDIRESFRRSLVELMLMLVEIWERDTGTGRLELAEKSRIWRVTIDDGRLRARAMERYLSLSKLPQNPRWRDVLRSAYFVLGQCAMETPVRDELQKRVDALLAYTRRSALV